MTLELPRFNQRFVSRLQPGSDEQRFVSNVGDVTFLTGKNFRTIHQVRVELIEPLYEIGLNNPSSSVERALYFQSYGAMFESELSNKGLHEYVIALNGLKDSLVRLKGRNIAWADGSQDSEDQVIRFDEYISDSMIGFYPNTPQAPALSIGLSKEADQSGILVDLEAMWDIEIYPR